MGRDVLYCSSEEFFGLVRSNPNTAHRKDVSGWKPPDKQTKARNA